MRTVPPIARIKNNSVECEKENSVLLGRVNKYVEFTYFTDICIHYVLMNSVLYYRMSNFLIRLATLSLTVTCQNVCDDSILKFTYLLTQPRVRTS
jgi:hypothetical protein